MAIALKGDFIGFSFNEHRSEKLGIVRVSDGSRYNEDLVPTAQDKTVQVPGGDGFYYFGSDYTQRQFSINIAFDELTEKQFRELQQVGKLVFDERPYKYYMVKSGKPQLKYICFGKDGERTYKGEGTLTFTAYYPFAKSAFKFLEKEIEEETGKEAYVLRKTYPNIEEWAEASGMRAQSTLDKVPKNKDEKPIPGDIPVYNAGDLEADFILRFRKWTEAEEKVENRPVVSISLTGKDSSGNTKNILENNTLVASIHMSDIFHGKAGVQTAIYVFNLGVKHDTKQLVKFIDFTNDGYTRQNRKKSSQETNLKNTDHALERYEEIVNLVLYGKSYLHYFTEDEYTEDTISLDGNDWTYKQHQKIETIPTEDDFRDVVKEYLSWKVSMIMKEDMSNEN